MPACFLKISRACSRVIPGGPFISNVFAEPSAAVAGAVSAGVSSGGLGYPISVRLGSPLRSRSALERSHTMVSAPL